MPLLEDYMAAVRNLQLVVDNPESATLIQRRYERRYGLVDGAPPDVRSCFPTRLPRPLRDRNPGDHERGWHNDSGTTGAKRGIRGAGDTVDGGRERRQRMNCD